MIGVRLHDNVIVQGVRVGADRVVPVVAHLPEEEEWDEGTLFRDDGDLLDELFRERDVVTFGEAVALIELGVADPVEPDFDAFLAEVDAWRRAQSADGPP